MDEVLVLDIGGTKTNVSFVASNGKEPKILSSNVFLTDSYPENTIERITLLVGNNKKISNMSLSLPGVLSEDGVLKESYFLHEWLDYPFIKNLSEKLGVKNYVWETDVVCGAMGEYNTRVEKEHDISLLYLNLGTGIGAALIKDGKPFKSSDKFCLRMQKLVLPFEDEIYSGVDFISGGTLTKISGYDSILEWAADEEPEADAIKPAMKKALDGLQTNLDRLALDLKPLCKRLVPR